MTQNSMFNPYNSSSDKPTYLFVLPWEINLTGGVNQVVNNLFRKFEEGGSVNPILMVNKWESTKAITRNIDGKTTIYLQLRSIYEKRQAVKNLLMFVVSIFGNLKQLHKLIDKHNITVINVHYPDLWVFQLCLLRFFKLFKGKFILSFHGTDFVNASNTKGIEKFLWTFVLKSADAIVPCSKKLGDDIISFFHVCHSKVKVIHNGVEESLPDKCVVNPILEGKLKDKRFLLHIGAFRYIKGQDILLKAFYKVSRKYPYIYLVMIGTRGDVRIEELEHIASEFGVSDKTLILENIPHNEIGGFLGRTEIVIVPSRREAFPMVILEAGVFSAPLVASRVGGIPEIITHDETGILCEPDNADILAYEMTLLLGNQQKRKRLGVNLNRRVLAHFTWESSYQKYLELL